MTTHATPPLPRGAVARPTAGDFPSADEQHALRAKLEADRQAEAAAATEASAAAALQSG